MSYPRLWWRRYGPMGVYSDQFMSLGERFNSRMRPAQVRQRIAARVARTGWGLGAGVLRATHGAVGACSDVA